MVKHKKIWLAGVPVLLAAIVTGGAMIYSQRADSPPAPADARNEVTIGDDNGNGCVNLGAQGTVNCNVAPQQNRTPYGTDKDPSGVGPWSFRVFDTVVDGTDLGLTVRTCPEQECGCRAAHCEKIGIARNGSPLFAVCQLDSGFNGGDTSSVWLKIRWPSDRAGDLTPRISSVQDPYLGWVLKKYTTPAGHNGNVSACA